MKKQLLLTCIVLLALMPMRADAKSDPLARFEVGGKPAAGPTFQCLNDVNESVKAGFYMPTPYEQDGQMYTLNKTIPVSELSFHSTLPDVAYMDANGKLQLVAKGHTTISASWPGNEEWNSGYAEIEVYVSEPLYLRVAGQKVTRYNMSDIMGDGKAVYDSLKHTLTLHGVTWDFSDHNIDAKYGVIEYWGPCDSLIIELDGVNTFTNTTIGINTKAHDRETDLGDNDVYIRSINDGILRCSGDDSQVLLDGWLIVEAGANIQIACDSRWETAVTAGGMWVDDGCQIVISSEGERGKAADIPFLELDDHVYLQGCKYISYEISPSLYGFYTENGEVAWMVAILSEQIGGYGEAETADSEKETNINLGESSSEDTEDIAMISLGENDQYNDETKQLELSTVLSDKEVEDALALFGPGASALKYMLPGSISFFIPAGKGSIQIECKTGFGDLKLMLQGLPAVTLSQVVMGWANVDYDVEVDTYVVIYLASKIHAPARMPAIQLDEEPVVGAYIKGIKITPNGVASGINALEQKPEGANMKRIENGQLLILRGDKTYTVMGQEIK